MVAMTSRPPRHAVRRPLAAVVAAAVLLLAPGCGTASDPSPPAGVDGLTIPTPAPEPDDFVDEIDNPWLGLDLDHVRLYRSSSLGHLVVNASLGPEIAGVATTQVQTSTQTVDPFDEPGAAFTPLVTDYYAQDEAGNVWWFGREGDWQAGVDGAEAGIAMLAKPRLGDGYAQAEPGPRAEIVALDGITETEAGAFDDLLVIETTEPDGRVLRSHYARGVGLVLLETVTGTPDETLELVAS